MQRIYYQIPLYRFLQYCSEYDISRSVYEKDCFGAVYSYNSIFHMTKKDIAVALKEMKRVLKPQGLMFVNFLTTDDFR